MKFLSLCLCSIVSFSIMNASNLPDAFYQQGQTKNPFNPFTQINDPFGKNPLNCQNKDELVHAEWAQENFPNGIPSEAALFFDRFTQPHKYEQLGAPAINGALIYGKPGTGKTLFARTLAEKADIPFIYTSGSDYKAHLHGLGKEKIKEIFSTARIRAFITKAQQLEQGQFDTIEIDKLIADYLEGENYAYNIVEQAENIVAQSGERACAVVFIDEIDAIASRRTDKGDAFGSREQLNELLTQMDGFVKNPHCNIAILGATNMESSIDPALLRPGRFDKVIEIPLPTKQGRKDIISLYLKKNNIRLNCDDVSTLVDQLANKTNQFSGAEIQELVGSAALLAGHNNQKYVTDNDFLQALKRIRTQKYNAERKKKKTPSY